MDQPEETDYVDLWKRSYEYITDRRTYESSGVELLDLPDDRDVTNYIDSFLEDPLTQASLDDKPTSSWTIKLVPIEHLVSFQPAVTATAYSEEVPTASDDLLASLRYALPVDATPLVEDQQIWDNYFTGWQFVSRSPNFYVSGPYQSRPDTDDAVFSKITFELKANPNFISVGHFEDRYILRNGYHRTFQLMVEGATHVPAVVIDAETYDDAGATSSGFFDREVVMGDRPPLLPDYDSPIAIDLHRRAENHVVRIIAETTDVLR
jgi:hypothetical protein